MVTRRVSEESLEAAKSSLTRRVTNRLLRYVAKVSAQTAHNRRIDSPRLSFFFQVEPLLKTPNTASFSVLEIFSRFSRGYFIRPRLIRCRHVLQSFSRVHISQMQQTSSIDWPEMLKTHESWLRKVLRCRVRDAHAVDDLFQEIAVAVYRQLDPRKRLKDEEQRAAAKSTLPQDPQKVGPWLYRVAIRQAVSFHRKQSRVTEPKIVSDLNVESPAIEPLDWMLNKEADQALKNCIEKLNDSQREILMLKFTENWSYRQLADRIGVSERAIEHRLAKARKTLRQLLIDANHQANDMGNSHD